ncbi:3-methyl-2-oxobutanoate hydroxymethyltransferase [Aestuariivirga litoralis]|uniref:3-methyl-2-oxobutanoate hydroxymethyltransferase n=1 Tax=Aestuariivirga litoralis TaxID=2650924 RepID=UPI0018C67533|nr:3-methyl-2-oxobutanoate hydroxymethyltransferase [Aestuariivirga litoralis]MBG1231077.1 3-methyl-2-oxobutanoate hydroxymethyltransferase [Aestuariivirga litoralis]
MARRIRPTVAEIRANKGKHQYTMMRVESWEELAAAEISGIDMVSVPPELLMQKQFREVAPSLFAVPGLPLYASPGVTDDYLRWAFEMMNAGADAVYCAAAFDTVERMAKDNIPVIGHVGLVPHFCTWTGGFKAVGKTAASAMQVYDRCKRYEEVGAFGVEIEVVPPEVTAEISKHTDLFLVSMGGGAGGDCQYLFACDVLGYNAGHVPRHAKKYADLAAEHARVQEIRVSAFKEFVSEVQMGGYPSAANIVSAPRAEMEAFKKMMSGKS